MNSTADDATVLGAIVGLPLGDSETPGSCEGVACGAGRKIVCVTGPCEAIGGPGTDWRTDPLGAHPLDAYRLLAKDFADFESSSRGTVCPDAMLPPAGDAKLPPTSSLPTPEPGRENFALPASEYCLETLVACGTR
mmetsp:Transcript_155933/g.275524  ORF Transcript_155933/g.275524 Transcript_155933/m.275524 type:complete len:136 (-) Transcript_155933:248-655(-)